MIWLLVSLSTANLDGLMLILKLRFFIIQTLYKMESSVLIKYMNKAWVKTVIDMHCQYLIWL